MRGYHCSNGAPVAPKYSCCGNPCHIVALSACREVADPCLVSVRLQFTGSQESILHLDIEEVAAFGLVDSPHPGRGRLQGQGHGQGLQPAREPQSPSPQLPATPQHDEDPQSATRVSIAQALRCLG